MSKKKVKLKKVNPLAKKTRKIKKKQKERYFISYVPEVKLLEKGHVPNETKMGTEFKGKNKVLVTK